MLLKDDTGIDLEMIGALNTSRFGGLRQMSVGAVAAREVLLPGAERKSKPGLLLLVEAMLGM